MPFPPFPPAPPLPPFPQFPPPPPAAQPVHPPEVVVIVDSSGWESAIRGAINSKNQIKIVLRGQRAAALRAGFPDICKVPTPPASFVPVPFPNVEMSLRAAGLLQLALIIAFAAGAGYAPPGMNYNRRGAGDRDDLLTIYLR